MSARRIVLAMLAALVVLAGCASGRMPTFQGWVEAELIFVGPDEYRPHRDAHGARG